MTDARLAGTDADGALLVDRDGDVDGVHRSRRRCTMLPRCVAVVSASSLPAVAGVGAGRAPGVTKGVSRRALRSMKACTCLGDEDMVGVVCLDLLCSVFVRRQFPLWVAFLWCFTWLKLAWRRKIQCDNDAVCRPGECSQRTCGNRMFLKLWRTVWRFI